MEVSGRRNRLWVKLIKSIYGEYGGLWEEGVSGRSSGEKWSDIIKVGNDIEKTQVPFIGSFRKKIFSLESNKQVSVSGRGSWGIDGGWKWEWGVGEGSERERFR
ncbi:hypothetical protein Tco_1103600 [Tanacetum coccineum]